MASPAIDLLLEQQKQFNTLQAKYQDYPSKVHLETIAACNASCSFCVYPDIKRKGTRMSDELIYKVIDDLTAIPIPFTLLPYKVSDPFLEARLIDILKLVNTKLSNARIEIVTNGNAMTEQKLEELRAIKKISKFVVSLNYHQPDEYKKVMGLDFDRTINRLDILHKKKAGGLFGFPIVLRKIGSFDPASYSDFIQWAHARYPAFKVELIWTNDWLGDRNNFLPAKVTVPDAPCSRWFDLSITATGEVAFCCMDGDAKYLKGDVNTQNAIDIYNRPDLRERRQSGPSRKATGAPCDQCTYLQAALISKLVPRSVVDA